MTEVTLEKPAETPLRELLDFINTTDLVSVEIEKDGRRIALKRTVEIVAAQEIPAADVPVEPALPKTVSIRSPIVGRFYGASERNRPPLIVEGGHISAGQKVAIVEAMKIKKDVISAYSGTVVRILLRDGDPVEYGQEIFVVEPSHAEVGE